MRVLKLQRVALALGTFFLASSIAAIGQTTYVSQPGGSDVKVDGTSSLHDWEMEGTLIGGRIEFGPGVELDPAQTSVPGIQDNKVPAIAHILIPVRGVHSKADHLPDVMDGLMQKALKEPQFPRIEFALRNLSFKGPHPVGKPFDFDVTGDLAIAGVTNKVTFPVTIECLDAGKLKISGTVPVKMSDYGVDPPAPNFGLGMMKCGDGINIIFDWMVHKR
jgi:hypothetical protein